MKTCLFLLRRITTLGHRSAMASASLSWAPSAPGMERMAFFTFRQVAYGHKTITPIFLTAADYNCSRHEREKQQPEGTPECAATAKRSRRR